MNEIHISIIIPAHNEEPRLRICIMEWIRQFKGCTVPFEILIVENGSSDNTYQLARELAGEFQQIYAYSVQAEPRNGKGIAVRYGMTMARGTWRYMADVDLSTPPDMIWNFLRAACESYPCPDIIIGSRAAPGASVQTSLLRLIPGRIFSSIINLVLDLKIADTQCGYKMFRGDVADILFQETVIPGWAFDVEVLYLARMHKYNIRELGIFWHNSNFSHVHLVEDSLRMLHDVLLIRKLHNKNLQIEKVPA